MSKGSRTDLCGGWPERAIPTATVGVLVVGGPRVISRGPHSPLVTHQERPEVRSCTPLAGVSCRVRGRMRKGAHGWQRGANVNHIH